MPSNCHCCCCWFAVVASVPLVHTQAKISDFYTFLLDDCALCICTKARHRFCVWACVEFPFNTNCRISPLRNWTRYVHCCNSNGIYNCFSYHAMPPVVGVVCYTGIALWVHLGARWVDLFSLCRHETIPYMHFMCGVIQTWKRRHYTCMAYYILSLLIHQPVFVCWIVNNFKVKMWKETPRQSAGSRLKLFSKTPDEMEIAALRLRSLALQPSPRVKLHMKIIRDEIKVVSRNTELSDSIFRIWI